MQLRTQVLTTAIFTILLAALSASAAEAILVCSSAVRSQGDFQGQKAGFQGYDFVPAPDARA